MHVLILRRNVRTGSVIPVSFFHFLHQLVSAESSSYGQDQTLNGVLGAVDVQQTTDHHRQPAGIDLHTRISQINHSLPCLCLLCSGLSLYLLYVDLDVFLQAVAVQVQNEIVDEIEAVAHDDERQLICEFGFLCNDTTEKHFKTCLQINTNQYLMHL